MARLQSPSRWICPLCERSVPADVDACYCGTSRAAVEAHARRERERTRRPFPWALFFGELGLVAIVVYWLLSPTTPTASPVTTSPSAPVAAPAVIRRETPRVIPSSLPNAVEATPTPAPLPAADDHGPVAGAEPVMSSTSKRAPRTKPERTETDLEREAGEKHLEQIFAKLGAEMAQLSENARQFEGICLGRRGDARSCARLHEDIASASGSLAGALGGTDDEARRASIPPGLVRDLRQKHGLEEDAWRDLQEKVRRLTAQYQGND